MIAYKGFNNKLICTMGKGQFQYEVGKIYKENKAECANAGFHCVEEPIEVLSWYRQKDSRYCIVEAGGDIHEDGCERISCSEMRIIKEITLEQIGALECEWLRQHPERKYSRNVMRDSGIADKDGIVVVRGKCPMAAGKLGSTIFLLKEGRGTKEIVEAGAYRIDGKNYMPDTFYNVKGRERRCRKVS